MTSRRGTLDALLAHPRLDLWFLATMLVAAALIRAPTLGQPLLEAHGFRQTQTAYTALVFHEQGISLLRPQVPVLGPPFEVPFELPVFQAVASLVMDAGVRPDTAVRGTCLVFFLLTGAVLFGFVRRFAGRLPAAIALVAFLFSPFGLLWGRTSMIEYLATAAAVGFAWSAIEWRERRQARWAAAALLVGSLALLVKVTTGIVYAIPILLYRASRETPGARGWLRARLDPVLAAILGVPLALAALWTHHADAVKAESPATAWLTSGALREWNFGTLRQRLELDNWTTILDRVLTDQVGGVAMLLVVAYGVAVARNRALWVGWMLAGVAAVAVFFNLHVVHDYYQISVSPVVSTGIGLGGAALLVRLAAGRRAVALAGAAACAIWFAGMLASTTVWKSPWAEIDHGIGDLATAASVAARSSPDELVAVLGYDWSPSVLYYARRKGTMVAPAIDEERVLRALPSRHRLLLAADPWSNRIEELSRWPWFAPVAPGLYRAGPSRSGLGGTATAMGTTDAAAVAAAKATGTPVGLPHRLPCGDTGMEIPPGGELWLVLETAPPGTRLTVDGAPAPFPGVPALVLAPSDAPRELRCAGAEAVEIESAVRRGE